MTEVNFYDEVDDSLLEFAVIISKSNGKWVFCKHKERDTFEVPGGHRETGEKIEDTAVRELKEETGLCGEMKEIGRAVRHDHHSFYVVYLCEADFEKNSIVLQEGETIGYKWVDKETMFKLDGNELASSRTVEIVKKLDL